MSLQQPTSTPQNNWLAGPHSVGRALPVRVLLVLTALGIVGVLLCSHLDSRTAAYFEPWQTIATGGLPNGLTLADDDGDGDLDLWVGHEREKMLRHYRNNGYGRFKLADRLPSGEGLQVRLADFNEDGRLDAVVSSFNDAALHCHLSQGATGWLPAQVVCRNVYSFDAWTGDLDGDGHADALVDNRKDSAVVLFGDGTGRFPGQQRLWAGPHGLGVLAADVDGDGDGDVLLTSATNGRTDHYVRLYRNLGQRRFELATSIEVHESPQRLAVADVDGDGDPDLLATAYVTNQVDLCLNDGHGNFTAPRTLPTGPHPFAIAVADVDADGRPDVLTTSTAARSVSLLRNLGDGQFAAPVAFEVGTTPDGLAVADLDGDGEPDVITTNYADDTLTLLRHSRPPLVWWPLALSTLVGVSYTAYIRQRQQHQREHSLRAELAAELHDELGSLLTRVTMRAELLEARHNNPQLLALVQESRTAAATVRDIIWSVDTTADTVEALLDRLRATVEVIRRDTEQEVHLQLALPDSLLAVRLRATVRQQVYLIGREGLTNALRHGRRHGPLAISLRLDAKELLLRIENDTRTEVAGPDGQGLRSMQTRAADVGGTLQAGPKPGGGWQVLLRVPRPLA